MRKTACILGALLLCGSAQGTGAATQLTFANKPIFVPYYPGMKNAAAMRASFAPAAAEIAPSQIALCANLAAIRALGARAAGADNANQSRMADLTFALCLTGSPAGN